MELPAYLAILLNSDFSILITVPARMATIKMEEIYAK